MTSPAIDPTNESVINSRTVIRKYERNMDGTLQDTEKWILYLPYQTQTSAETKNSYVQTSSIGISVDDAYLLQFSGAVQKYTFSGQLYNLEPDATTSYVRRPNGTDYTVCMDGVPRPVRTIGTMRKFLQQFGSSTYNPAYDLTFHSKKYEYQNENRKDFDVYESQTIRGSPNNARLNTSGTLLSMLTFDFYVGSLRGDSTTASVDDQPDVQNNNGNNMDEC